MSGYNSEASLEKHSQCRNESDSLNEQLKQENTVKTLEPDKEYPLTKCSAVDNVVNGQHLNIIETEKESKEISTMPDYDIPNESPCKDVDELEQEANLSVSPENSNVMKLKIDETLSLPSENTFPDIDKLNISDNTQNNKHPSSAVIVNKQTDSFRNLLFYNSDDSDDSDISDSTDNDNESLESSEDDDEDSESDESSESDDSNEDPNDDVVCIEAEQKQNKKEITMEKTNSSNKRTAQSALYSFEELDRFTMPLLPDLSKLQIDYLKEDFLHIGHVQAIVETLVTIEAIRGTPSYNLDTILFVEDEKIKKPLGAIYDVIGPVLSPIYCIRLNTEEELQEKGIKLNMKVYSAPKSDYTKYVFVSELMKIKGTDASWLDDKEMPHGVDESSGDEQECQLEPVTQKRKRHSLEKHKKFEKSMNHCNALHTTVSKLMDYNKVLRVQVPQSPLISNVGNAPYGQIYYPSMPETMNRNVNPGQEGFLAGFNPAVPPPPIFDVRNITASYLNNHQYPTQDQIQQPDSSQSRFYRFPHNPSHNNQSWRHHPGPSRGHGQY